MKQLEMLYEGKAKQVFLTDILAAVERIRAELDDLGTHVVTRIAENGHDLVDVATDLASSRLRIV